jgi:hypothetical protein
MSKTPVTKQNIEIGSEVKYIPDYEGAGVEHGFITSYNDNYVFVSFAGNPTSQACSYNFLFY